MESLWPGTVYALLVVAALRHIFEGIRNGRCAWSAVNAPVKNIVPGDERIEVVCLGLRFEFGFELIQLFRIFACEIDAFGRIVVQVVKLPGVLIEGLRAGCIARDEAAGISKFGFPAFFVDRPRSEDVVVLFGMMPRSVRVIDRIGKGKALDRLLLDAANLLGSLDADQVERGGKKVDNMAILSANSTFFLIPLGQYTISGLCVPPSLFASCFQYLNGVSAACAQPSG